MITLKNGTKGTSRIGFLAKMSNKDGYFELAGAGDNPIGVISESVGVNQPCKLITNGEALVHVHKKVQRGGTVILKQVGDGAPRGSAVPLNDESEYTSIGVAMEGGKGVIKVAVSINIESGGSGSAPSEDGLPTGGTTGQFLKKDSATDYDASWATASGTGDMLAVTYDPTGVADDAFDMDNMVEGSSTKIFTSTERSKLAGIDAGADINLLTDNKQIITWTQGKGYEPGTITRDAEGRVTSMTVVWPDDSVGTYTATDYNATHEVYDGYTITHTDSAQTVTQSAVTRNSDGAITVKPVITIA